MNGKPRPWKDWPNARRFDALRRVEKAWNSGTSCDDEALHARGQSLAWDAADKAMPGFTDSEETLDVAFFTVVVGIFAIAYHRDPALWALLKLPADALKLMAECGNSGAALAYPIKAVAEKYDVKL